MLTKLMKYELKATSRLLIPLYLILLLLSVINRFVFKLNDYDGIAKIINVFFMASYIILIFVVLIVTVIYMIVRFYKNLLTDEGYLMFTLPTKSHQLITSKLLITVLWTILSIAVILISLFIVFATPDSIPSIIEGIRQTMLSINRDFGGNSVLFIIEVVIMCLLSLVANILLIYVSIALGQLFSKHKIIGSFAAYMAIYTVIQFLMLMLFGTLGVYTSNKPNIALLFPKVFFPLVIVMLIIMGVGCYIGTNYIFKRKLNLD